MRDKQDERSFLYMPDRPNVGDVDPADDGSDPQRSALDRAQADDIASKVSIGDELFEYERVSAP